MAQLKMIRMPAPVKQVSLPEGFSISTYRPGLDVEWLNICQGLTKGIKPIEHFVTKVLENPTLCPERVFFVIAPDNHGAATASARLHPEGHGTLHMVEALPEYRGKGLGKAICTVAVGALQALGVPFVDLTTDDFRVPAIKTYLGLNFMPVLYQEDMRGRWTALKESLGRETILVFNEKMDLELL